MVAPDANLGQVVHAPRRLVHAHEGHGAAVVLDVPARRDDVGERTGRKVEKSSVFLAPFYTEISRLLEKSSEKKSNLSLSEDLIRK